MGSGSGESEEEFSHGVFVCPLAGELVGVVLWGGFFIAVVYFCMSTEIFFAVLFLYCNQKTKVK